MLSSSKRTLVGSTEELTPGFLDAVPVCLDQGRQFAQSLGVKPSL
jgi:hypothetical protein